jgi:hypothetical protein
VKRIDTDDEYVVVEKEDAEDPTERDAAAAPKADV